MTWVNVQSAPIRINAKAMLRLPTPTEILPVLRTPLRHMLRQAPERPLTSVLALALTHLLRGQRLTERLPELAGKRVSLQVTDLDHELRFRITASGLAADWSAAWDVRIRGRFDDFWQLATRGEDPDTLFFTRRLAIEGETETGLALKNLLDGLEYDWRAHVRAVTGIQLPGPQR